MRPPLFILPYEFIIVDENHFFCYNLTEGGCCMKKRFVVIIAILLAAALLPLPQKIKRTYCAVDTLSGEEAVIRADLTHLRFLIFKDRLFGSIELKTDDNTYLYGKHLNYQGQSPNNTGDCLYDFGGWYFNEETQLSDDEYGNRKPLGFEAVLIHFSSDFDKILVLHHTKDTHNNERSGKMRFVGSTDKAALAAARDYFTGYYDRAEASE